MENKITDLMAKIEASNVTFAKLPKTKKRVVIAQDCLERINIGQLNPSRGKFIYETDLTYLMIGEFDDKFRPSTVSKVDECSLKTRFNEMPTCSACAKGSLFLSFVGRVNAFDVNDINFKNNNATNDKSHSKLLEIFDIRQLALIEYAFERVLFIDTDLEGKPINFTEATRKKAIRFYETYPDSKDRMIAICENIIANNGTFKL